MGNEMEMSAAQNLASNVEGKDAEVVNVAPTVLGANGDPVGAEPVKTHKTQSA